MLIVSGANLLLSLFQLLGLALRWLAVHEILQLLVSSQLHGVLTVDSVGIRIYLALLKVWRLESQEDLRRPGGLGQLGQITHELATLRFVWRLQKVFFALQLLSRQELVFVRGPSDVLFAFLPRHSVLLLQQLLPS